MTTVTNTPPSRPEGAPLNHEILRHGCLRLGREQPGERAYYVRYHSLGRFIEALTPDANWHDLPHSRLVRIYALDAGDALRALNYHYGRSLDRAHPIEIEEREPVEIINAHMHTIVVWPIS